MTVNEHWLVMAGSVVLKIEGREIELTTHEVALLRAGTQRRISSKSGARVVVAREH